MDFDLTTLLVAALATWGAVEIWRHGEIFSSARAGLELREGFFVRLLSCPFCLSPWVAVLAVVILATPLWEWRPDGSGRALTWLALIIAKCCVYALAVARLANLGNDLAHGYCRTPHAERDVIMSIESADSTELEDEPEDKEDG